LLYHLVLQERRQTHEAATVASEEGARLALKAAEHAAKLRQDALQEREELKAKKNLTFSQKVRRCCQSMCMCQQLCG
jgi:hypothetical protein